jgi:hypothetical protein
MMSEVGSISAPTAASQVEAQLITLSERAGELLQRIGDLSARLAPVSREEDPGDNKEGMPREILVPIAERIALTVDTLDDTLNTLASALRRLEI